MTALYISLIPTTIIAVAIFFAALASPTNSSNGLDYDDSF